MNLVQIVVMWAGIACLVGYSLVAVSGYGNSQRVGTLIEVLSFQLIIVSLTIGIIFQIGYRDRRKDARIEA